MTFLKYSTTDKLSTYNDIMPQYEYEHRHQPEDCPFGKVFEIMQSIADEKLTRCPQCNGDIFRRISAVRSMTTVSDSQLKTNGFAKLVRRDKGVYENVTAQDNEPKFLKLPQS